jgi:ketosteroid isomerase-like protein
MGQDPGRIPAVSKSNLETYRRMIEAFNQEGVEGSMRFFSEDAEVYDPDAPRGRSYRGREAVAAFLAELIEGMAEVEVRDFELIPAGDRVVGLIHTYGRGAHGGPEIELRDAHTLTFRDGKVVYWRAYLDPNEALGDAGLGPAPKQPEAGR